MFKPIELGILAQGFDTLATDENATGMVESWFTDAIDIVAQSEYSDVKEEVLKYLQPVAEQRLHAKFNC